MVSFNFVGVGGGFRCVSANDWGGLVLRQKVISESTGGSNGEGKGVEAAAG